VLSACSHFGRVVQVHPHSAVARRSNGEDSEKVMGSMPDSMEGEEMMGTTRAVQTKRFGLQLCSENVLGTLRRGEDLEDRVWRRRVGSSVASADGL
jgi:hypothetical protein